MRGERSRPRPDPRPRRRERVAVGGSNPDRRSPADGQLTNGLGDLARRAQLELDFVAREPPLVENDDAVLLQPDDVLRPEVDGTAAETRSHARRIMCLRPKKPGSAPAPASARRSRRPWFRA